MSYSIKQVLDKVKWHPEFDFSRVVVRYVDRPKGLSELKGSEIRDVGHKFIYTESFAIPHHRVVEIIYDGRVIWRR